MDLPCPHPRRVVTYYVNWSRSIGVCGKKELQSTSFSYHLQWWSYQHQVRRRLGDLNRGQLLRNMNWFYFEFLWPITVPSSGNRPLYEHDILTGNPRSTQKDRVEFGEGGIPSFKGCLRCLHIIAWLMADLTDSLSFYIFYLHYPLGAYLHSYLIFGQRVLMSIICRYVGSEMCKTSQDL